MEYQQRNKWREMTRGMGQDRRGIFRKQLDPFLWRVQRNLNSVLESATYSEVTIHLQMLGEYLTNCPTRILPAMVPLSPPPPPPLIFIAYNFRQVVDIALDSLLRLKHLISTRGKFATLRLNEFRLMHNLLVVFDEIATQNSHMPINDLLLSLFVERDDTLTHTKDYMSAVLFGSLLEKELAKDPGKGNISDFQIRIIRHFEICVGIFNNRAR